MTDIMPAVRLLRSAKDLLILTHENPDGDTLGSAFALCFAMREHGVSVNVINSEELPRKYSCIYDGYTDFDFIPQTVISVDVADKMLLGCLEDEYSGKVELSIDHHASGREFAKITVSDHTSASASEIVYKIILELYGEISDRSLRAVYCGVCTDTGCFKYSNTTILSHEIATKCIERGLPISDYNSAFFDLRTRTSLELEKAALESIEYFFDGKVCVISLSRAEIDAFGAQGSDLDIFAPMTKSIEGVCVGIFIKEKQCGECKISLRTDKTVNATEICAVFGGGGHPRAAGCSVKADMETAKKLILSELGKVWTE